jgi:hypothetical protein
MSSTESITFALRSLGLTASGMKPHSVGYLKGFEPNRADIRDFQNDLYLIAGKVDRVLEEYGAYLQSLGIVSAQDVKDHFTNVLYSAIDGNATFAIDRGITARIEDAAYAQ